MTEDDDLSGLYEWVRHSQVEARKAAGWTVAGNGFCHHHGRYCVLMRLPEPAQVDNPDTIRPGCD